MEEPRARHGYSVSSFDGEGLPVDKRSKSYRIMMLLGCGLLLPWNAVLTAFDYFQNLYNDPTFEFGVPLSNQVTNFLMLLFMIKYGTQWSFTKRILAMFVVYDVLLIVLPPIGMLVGAGYKDVGLVLTYTVFAGFGASCAVLQSSLFGFAGLLPQDYTQAIMAGQGISGVFMNILMMACQAATEKIPSTDAASLEAWLFFGIAALVVVCCIFGYMAMVRTRFTRYHVPDVDEMNEPLTRAEEDAFAARLQCPASPGCVPSPTDPKIPEMSGLPAASEQLEDPMGSQPLQAQLGPRSRSYQEIVDMRGGDEHLSPNQVQRKYFSSSSVDHGTLTTQQRVILDRERALPANSPMGPFDMASFKSLFDDVPNRTRGQERDRRDRTPPQSKSTLGDEFRDVSQRKGSSRDGSFTEHMLPPSDAAIEAGVGSIPGSPGLAEGWDEALEGDLEPMPEVSVWAILGKIGYYGSTVFFIFLISLLIFPGFLTVTCAKGPFESWGESWYRLVLVTMFNVADTAGRFIAPPFISMVPHRSLCVVALVRVIMVPLFYWFVYDTIDWWWGPLFFTFVLGVSNGFFGSICMMHGPSMVEAHEREMAGTLMAFCLMMGIILGSALQLVVAQFMKDDHVGECTN